MSVRLSSARDAICRVLQEGQLLKYDVKTRNLIVTNKVRGFVVTDVYLKSCDDIEKLKADVATASKALARGDEVDQNGVRICSLKEILDARQAPIKFDAVKGEVGL